MNFLAEKKPSPSCAAATMGDSATEQPAPTNGEAAPPKTATTNGHKAAVNGHKAADSLPVLIIGAGPSGLLLAQSLRRRGVPFRIFERDGDFTTRGIGWGLTLNWALPIMRELLPDGLGDPDTLRNLACVDRKAVEDGDVSRFPYYNLTTAERITAAPPAPETHRLRVTRQRLRTLLATKLDIEVELAHMFYIRKHANLYSGTCHSPRPRTMVTLSPHTSTMALPYWVALLSPAKAPSQYCGKRFSPSRIKRAETHSPCACSASSYLIHRKRWPSCARWTPSSYTVPMPTTTRLAISVVSLDTIILAVAFAEIMLTKSVSP